MIFENLLEIYTQPEQVWRRIDKKNEGIVTGCLSHLLLITLFPPLFCYISSVHIGWRVGQSAPFFLTPDSALAISIAMYLALLIGVLLLGYLTYWMSQTFGAKPTLIRAIELATYTATPLFMTSIAAMFPQLWVLMLAGLTGVAYSVYLLYTGIPILMHIPEEQGFIYSSSIVTAGLVLLIAIITSSVLLWAYGIGPVVIR